MITTIKTKALRDYWFKQKRLDMPPKAAKKVKRILLLMNEVGNNSELFDTFRTPGFNLQKYHERKYDDDWEIRVSGNWRMLFRWDGANISEVEYTDTTH